MLLLAPFASKLVNYLNHGESVIHRISNLLNEYKSRFGYVEHRKFFLENVQKIYDGLQKDL